MHPWYSSSSVAEGRWVMQRCLQQLSGDQEWVPWLLPSAISFATLPLVHMVVGFGVTTHVLPQTQGAPHTCYVSILALLLQRCHSDVSHFTKRQQWCELREQQDLWTEREAEGIAFAAWKPQKRCWKSWSSKLNDNTCLWEPPALSIIGIFVLDAARICPWGERAGRMSQGTVTASELQET